VISVFLGSTKTQSLGHFGRNLLLKTPIWIAVSGYGQDSDQERALKAGFNAYLTKPIDFNKLERLLRKVATGESGFQILYASARWFKAACWSPRRVSGVLIQKRTQTTIDRIVISESRWNFRIAMVRAVARRFYKSGPTHFQQ